MPESPPIFFIAHAGADVELAKQLRNLLHPELPVFLDACDLVAGDDWYTIIPARQRAALATVALVSSRADAAYYLREELASAIALHRKEPEAHRLIPVFLDGVPADPSQIPYGLRVKSSLDAVRLGMDGVAAELRRIAASLTGKPAPEPPPETAERVDRMQLFDRLCKLLPSQFEEVLFRVGAPRQHLAPATEPMVRRVIDLFQWAESQDPDGLTVVRDTLRTASPASRGR